MLNSLSLGAGVQSTTVALMAVTGDLPYKLDHAIFADTGWEPAAVYRHLDWLQPILEDAGIAVHRVTVGNIRDDALDNGRSDRKRVASIPLHVRSGAGGGMLRRQCTSEYKINPVQRKERELLGLKPRQRGPAEPALRVVFGISLDEIGRMRDSRRKWAVNDYPLVDARMTRHDCLLWLERNGWPEPPRSACIGCPYHSDAEWRRIRDETPEEWADAVDFDHRVRGEFYRGQISSDAYLHRTLVPLAEADIDGPEARGQLSMFGAECEGMCGL